MKIAIPTRGTEVDDHFGHCEVYTIVTVDNNGNMIQSENLPSSKGCGCKSDIASVLRQMGVSVMLAGNMGGGALNVLSSQGIQVYRGNSGDVHQLAESYLLGKLHDSGESCHQHSHNDSVDHVCKH